MCIRDRPVTVIHTPCALAWPVSALAGAAATRKPPVTRVITLAITLMRLGITNFLSVKDEDLRRTAEAECRLG